MWQLLTDPEMGRRCWDLIAEIERCLQERFSEDASGGWKAKDPTLASGEAGIALFFAYLHAAHQGTDAADHALEALDRSVEVLARADPLPGLYGGFCGIGWVVEHLTRELFEGDEDLSAEIGEALLRQLSVLHERPPYELMAGLSGFGTYLLERLPHPDAADLLGRVLDLLAETAEESEAGLTWYTRPEWLPSPQPDLMPEGRYDLGVAHGVPGVIGFLAAAQREGIDDPRIPRLAGSTVRWLLGQKMPPRSDSVFPAFIIPGKEPKPARTAWCYGDLGVAAVLLSAARSFDRPDWESEALSLARRAGGRSVEAMRVTEAGLCHGTAGIAHLFNRLYQATGDLEMKEIALAWYQRSLDRERRGEGLAGLLSWVREMPGEPLRGEHGFLNGLAGIGLALLAAATNVEPVWDRAMLVAIPPRPRTQRDSKGLTDVAGLVAS
jgi:hypothetical protein